MKGCSNSGDNFAARLKAGFKDSDQPQLVHVATDGESYGHHHKYGEMALAYALRLLEQDKTVKLTNYGSFLEQFPPEFECEIVDDTSWSCEHGVERWRSNCGCNGGKPGWNQEWRAPLRQALDELRDALAPLTEREGGKLFKDVWAARDAYIQVVLDRSAESVDRFFDAQQAHALSESERVRALELMEMQRHAQLMYTSCGWFFDDIAGIETVQVIAYAARVLQLAQQLFGQQAAPLEPAFLARLAEAHSNDPEAGDGARIYKKSVATMELDLEQVAAHYAISSIFSSFADETDLFCYPRPPHLLRNSYFRPRPPCAGPRARRQRHYRATRRASRLRFSTSATRTSPPPSKPTTTPTLPPSKPLPPRPPSHVQRADFPEVIRLLDRFYGHADYSLTSLFTDEQRRIVAAHSQLHSGDIENSLTTIYQDHASLLHYLSQAGLPKPPALTLAAGFAINAGLRRVLEGDPIDVAQMRSLLALAKADQVPLETATLSYIADQRMKRAMVELQMSAGSLEMLDRALMLARTIAELPFDLNLWQAQNIWYEILRTSSDALTSAWRGRASAMGEGFQRTRRLPHHRYRGHARGRESGCACGSRLGPVNTTWDGGDGSQFSILQHEALAAPHDCVRGKARHPQSHRDYVAQRQQPKIRQHFVIAQHCGAHGHGLRQPQKKAQTKQPEAQRADPACQHIQQRPAEPVREDQACVARRPRAADRSQPTQLVIEESAPGIRGHAVSTTSALTSTR